MKGLTYATFGRNQAVETVQDRCELVCEVVDTFTIKYATWLLPVRGQGRQQVLSCLAEQQAVRIVQGYGT